MKALLSSLVFAALLWPLASTPACGAKDEAAPAAAAEPTAASFSAKRAEQTAALAKAWEADANCRALATCCASLAGSTWEQTLTPMCGQIANLQDFVAQAKAQVDPALQAKDCDNRVQALAGMANASNPLPDGCLPR